MLFFTMENLVNYGNNYFVLFNILKIALYRIPKLSDEMCDISIESECQRPPGSHTSMFHHVYNRY